MNPTRFPLPVSHSRAPRGVSLLTALLVAALFFAAGLFAGAITFGTALLSIHS